MSSTRRLPRNSVVGLAFLAGLLAGPAMGAPKPERDAVFKTSDGWKLRGKYVAPAAGKPVVILLHGLGSASYEWEPFVKVLGEKGFGSLRFDARGHGESLEGPLGKKVDYKTFLKPAGKPQWQRMALDVDAAVKWLAKRKIRPNRIGIVGASLGANVALVAAASHPKFAFAVALSPSLDYQGIKPAPSLRKLTKRPLVFVSAVADRYSHRGTSLLVRSARKNKRSTFLQPETGHGVAMLTPDILEKLFPLLSD